MEGIARRGTRLRRLRWRQGDAREPAWRHGRLWIALVASAARVAIILLTPHFIPFGDPVDYQHHAVSIAAGHGFPTTVIASPGTPSAFRAPAYPFLLGGAYWLVGVHPLAGRALGATSRRAHESCCCPVSRARRRGACRADRRCAGGGVPAAGGAQPKPAVRVPLPPRRARVRAGAGRAGGGCGLGRWPEGTMALARRGPARVRGRARAVDAAQPERVRHFCSGDHRR